MKTNTTILIRRFIAIALAGGLLGPGALFAATNSWSGAGGDNLWTTAGNWDSAPLAGDTNQFDTTLNSANNIIDLGASDYTSGGIIVGATQNYDITITNLARTLTIGAFGINMESAGANLTLNVGTVTLGASQTWNVGASRTLNVSSIIKGTGMGITKSGTGTLTLSGLNTYTGATTVNAGVMVISNPSTAASITRETLSGDFSNNATVNFTSPKWGVLLTGNLSGSGTWNIAPASSDAALLITGTSGMAMTGQINIADGAELRWNPVNTSVASANTVTMNLNNTGLFRFYFDVAGKSVTVGGLTGTGTVSTTGSGSGGMLNIGAGDVSSSFGGIIANNGLAVSVTKLGAGILTLSGANTYTGGTALNGGTLSISGSGTIGGALTFNGGALQINTIKSLANATTITAGQTGTIDVTSGNSGTLTGIIGATTGALLKTGSGTLTLSGLNTYTGGTTVNDGVLALTAGGSNAGRIRNGLTINSGGTVSLTGAWSLGYGLTAAVKDIAINGGVLKWETGAVGGTVVTNITMTGGTISGVIWDWYNSLTSTPTLTAVASASGAVISSGFRLRLGAGGTLTVSVENGAATDDLLISGQITQDAAANIVKTGVGQLTLSGINTYTGGTTISGGTLTIGGTGQLGSGTYAGGITNDANFVYASSAAQTFSGILRGAGQYSINGTGTLTLTGANTFTGGLAITAGTVSGTTSTMTFGGSGTGAIYLGNTSSSDNAAIMGDGRTFANPITVQAGSSGNVLSIGNSGNTAAVFSGPVLLNNNLTVIGGGTGSIRLGGTLTGSGALTVSGGTVTLDGTGNTITGGVILSSGTTLKANSAAALGTGTLTINGGTLMNTSGASKTMSNSRSLWNNDFTFAGTDNLDLGAGTITMSASRIVNVTSDTLVVGVITGSGLGLTKIGAGQLQINANTAYTGPTLVTAGTLYLPAGKSITTSSSVTISNATLTLSDTGVGGGYPTQSSTINNLTLNNATLNIIGVGNGGAALALPNRVTITGTSTLTKSSGNYTRVGFLNGGIAGDGTLNTYTAGAGYHIYIGNNTGSFTGTINNLSSSLGNLAIASANGWGTGATLIVNKSVWVNYSDTGAIPNYNETLVTTDINQPTSKLVVNTGGTFNTAANITIGSLNGTGGTINLPASKTLSVGALGSNDTFGGVITGSGSFTKNGIGTLTLTGNSTYSGLTTVNGGTFIVTGSISNSALTATAGILAGNGYVGDATVQNGATLSPGTSIDTFKCGALTLASNSNFFVEIQDIGTFDKVLVSGVASLSNSWLSVLQIGSYTPSIGDSFTILTAGSVIGQFANGPTINIKGVDDWNYLFDITYNNGNSVVLSYGVIPEPSTWALVALALVPLFLRRRR